jgi:Ni,Fe-hydrogenase I cytochrome b subunit
MANQQVVRRTVHWLLTVVVIVYLLTGFGITEYRIVEPLTFGLLTRNLANRIHIGLEIPFIVLLVVHIWLLPLLNRFKLRRLSKRKAVTSS